jgi:hypothetical protein
MRKIGLLLGALLVSLSCHAGSTVGSDLKSAILKNTTKQVNSGGTSLIYGGQDFSRRVMATANESIWAGQPTYIG